MTQLTDDVCADIKTLIFSNIDEWKKNIEPSSGYNDDDCMDLTVACDDCGTQWSYQTGDNSFTGGAYSLPHWAVTYIFADSDPLEIYEHVIAQLTELLPDNR